MRHSFSLQLSPVGFGKCLELLSDRGRSIKTRRNKSNNCNAIYWNGKDEGRGREVYGKIHPPGTVLRSCYILSSDKFNMSSPIPLENQPFVRRRYGTADTHQTFICVYVITHFPCLCYSKIVKKIRPCILCTHTYIFFIMDQIYWGHYYIFI